MFCSSLRKRKEWAPASTALLRAQWTEKELNTHDAAFTVSGQGGMRAVFRLLLLCTGDVWHDETLERMERLSVLNGASHVAIVLLLAGDAAMAAFARLQMKSLSHGLEMPIIPITSVSDIVSCLDKLREQETERLAASVSGTATQRELLCHCVHGQTLSERQSNMILDSSSSFKEVVRDAYSQEAQEIIHDLLGSVDASRFLSFLKEGPRPTSD